MTKIGGLIVSQVEYDQDDGDQVVVGYTDADRDEVELSLPRGEVVVQVVDLPKLIEALQVFVKKEGAA